MKISRQNNPEPKAVTILSVNADRTVNVACAGKVYYNVRAQRTYALGPAKAIVGRNGEMTLL